MLFAFAAACGPGESNNGATNNGTTDPNNGVVMNNGVTPTWSSEVVASGNVGLHTRYVHAGGVHALAYFATSGRSDGLCEVATDNKPERIVWPLHYAQKTGGAWATEVVSELLHVGQPVGLDLIHDGSSPMLAAMTGEPLLEMVPFYCGVNDVGLWTRSAPGTWSSESVVASSGEAATGDAASDFGEVVGYWPGLARSSSGELAIAYKDVHAGSIQSDDMRRADLELALGQPGSWQNIAVDFGNGGGDYNRVAFDSQGRIYIAYYRATENRQGAGLGVWLTRSSDGGSTWESVQLFGEGTSEGPSLAFAPDGSPMVLFYNSARGFPQLAELKDDAQFASLANGWEVSDVGDSAWDEGYRGTIAQSPNGTLGVAYYRCNKASGTFGDCNPGDDGLVFAYRDRGVWYHEVVDPGPDNGLCGQYPTLQFDAAGIAHVAYQCENTSSGSIVNEVKFATRATNL